MISLPDVPQDVSLSLVNFLRAVKNKLENPEEVELKSYTVQELNDLTAANYTYQIVRCSNGDAGDECLAYCNGRAWYVVELGSRVSLT